MNEETHALYDDDMTKKETFTAARLTMCEHDVFTLDTSKVCCFEKR